jgi:hypothetical protein
MVATHDVKVSMFEPTFFLSTLLPPRLMNGMITPPISSQTKKATKTAAKISVAWFEANMAVGIVLMRSQNHLLFVSIAMPKAADRWFDLR